MVPNWVEVEVASERSTVVGSQQVGLCVDMGLVCPSCWHWRRNLAGMKIEVGTVAGLWRRLVFGDWRS